MPEPYTTQVGAEVTPGVELPTSANPDAFGAAVGQATENIAQAQAAIHAERIERASQIATLNAHNQSQEVINRLVYGRDGILNKPLGRDAPAGVDKVLSDYDQETIKIGATLASDDQRIRYKRMVANQRFDLERQLARYEHSETERFADQVDQAALKNTLTGAIQHADNPDAIESYRLIQDQVLEDAGRRKGLDAEVIQTQQREASSQLYLDVLKQLSSTGQDITARDFYEAHRDELTADDATRAASMVHAGSLAGESQRIADDIVLSKDGNLASLGDIQERIRTDARLQKNPQLRDEVQTRVDQRMRQEAAIARDRARATFTQAYTILRDPRNPQGIYDPRVVTLMSGMDPEEQEQLRGYAKKEGKVVTDPRLMRTIELGLADPKTREQWMSYDPTQYPNDIAADDMGRITAIQAKYLTESKQKVSDGTLTTDQAINAALTNAGLDPKKMRERPTNDPEQPNPYFFIDQEVRAIEDRTGKKLLPEEITKIGTALLVKRAYEGQSWYNSNRRPIEFTPAMIPKTFRDRIVNAAAEQRRSVSEQELLDQYLMQLSLDAINAR